MYWHITNIKITPPSYIQAKVNRGKGGEGGGVRCTKHTHRDRESGESRRNKQKVRAQGNFF